MPRKTARHFGVFFCIELLNLRRFKSSGTDGPLPKDFPSGLDL